MYTLVVCVGEILEILNCYYVVLLLHVQHVLVHVRRIRPINFAFIIDIISYLSVSSITKLLWFL